MKLDTTYIDRSNSNDVVIANANKALAGNKTVQLFAEVYKHRKLLLIQDILILRNEDPKRQTTLEPNRATPIDHGKKQIGRPKNRWAAEALKDYWAILGTHHPHTTKTKIHT